jgi:hypothetical protein
MLVVQVDMVDPESLQRRITALRTYSGRPLIRTQLPSGRCWLPNLVATTTSSRCPAIARPTSRSLVNGPYMSAVSKKVTPRSSAWWMVASDSCSSDGP